MRYFLFVTMLFVLGVKANPTVYVGNVKIPMRADASIAKNNIINYLEINTPIELIKKQKDGWSLVRYNGENGWVISRYLLDDNPYTTSDKLLEELSKQKIYEQLLELYDLFFLQGVSTHGKRKNTKL